jgi:hypothetical protein
VAVRHQTTQLLAPLKINQKNRDENEANQVSPIDQNLLIFYTGVPNGPVAIMDFGAQNFNASEVYGGCSRAIDFR